MKPTPEYQEELDLHARYLDDPSTMWWVTDTPEVKMKKMERWTSENIGIMQNGKLTHDSDNNVNVDNNTFDDGNDHSQTSGSDSEASSRSSGSSSSRTRRGGNARRGRRSGTSIRRQREAERAELAALAEQVKAERATVAALAARPTAGG